eukprot:COSAG01_NODE_47367_length_391_cov_0.616438_1_plen_26_part_10
MYLAHTLARAFARKQNKGASSDPTLT